MDVFRKDSRKLPIGDPDIDWEETVYLNLIIHQFEYTLTLAICTRTSPKELQVLKRHSQKVYASPSRRRMDTKGEVEEITFPHICFMVDNFDEVFHDILVRDGEMVCVELVASDRAGSIQGVIFLGSIRYDALKKVYDARVIFIILLLLPFIPLISSVSNTISPTCITIPPTFFQSLQPILQSIRRSFQT